MFCTSAAGRGSSSVVLELKLEGKEEEEEGANVQPFARVFPGGPDLITDHVDHMHLQRLEHVDSRTRG